MIDVKKLLEECTKRKITKDMDLVESGILDSLGLITFLSKLEDLDIEIPITRIDKKVLRKVETLQKYINELERENEKN